MKCIELYEEYLATENVSFGHELQNELNSSRHSKWRDKVLQMDFKHSSRQAWSLLKVPKDRVISVKKELRCERKALSYHPECSGDFTLLELESAIATMKQNS